MNGKIGLALILIMAISTMSVFAVRLASAQSAPTPAAPTFTMQLVGPPTVVNTTYSLNTNTGQIVADIGYTNQYSAMNITIKNQQFTLPQGSTFYLMCK